MIEKKAKKITFYADADIQEWLNSVGSRFKSKQINDILRQGMQNQSGLEEKLSLIDSRIIKLEKDAKFDGFAIAAIRRILLNRFGSLTTEEFKKEYDDLYFGAPRPPRKP